MIGDYVKSWGNYPYLEQSVSDMHWQDDVVSEINECKSKQSQSLAVGLGRSYGDSCFTTGSKLIRTIGLDRVISFDVEEGTVTAEAGISLDALLRIIVPKGWFLPVTPGTKYVTLGGAVANDVHGKNHHVKGTFGCFVQAIGLYRSDVGILKCTADHNAQYFNSCIGGLGLTGVILWVTIRLARISSSFLDVSTIRFRSIKEYFEIAPDMDKKHEFSVSWVDCTSRGVGLGRGVYTAGNFSENGSLTVHRSSKLSVPVVPPFSLVNRVSVKLFNEMYYLKAPRSVSRRTMHYEPFFYPLDGVLKWNRIYGSKGFQQYQCLIPDSYCETVIPELLSIISKSGIGSFLVVLKKCGDIKSPGMLSFPSSGMTLAIDFPHTENLQMRLLDTLNNVVITAGGRLYPAKDAQMSSDFFQKSYTNWSEFDKHRDPVLMSKFWTRVTA